MPEATSKKNFADDYMPYAPVQPVIAIITRYRERGLHDELSLKNLESLSIAAGNAPRVQRALEFLGLIDSEAKLTTLFERLGKATTGEYTTILAEVVRAAYAPIFAIVDPEQDTDIAINDAFRPYRPTAQRARMVTFFLGICREAGIVAGGPVERRPRARREPTIRTTTPARQAKVPAQMPSDRAEIPAVDRDRDSEAPDYRLIAAVVQQLPRDGTWDAARRQKWVDAMTATVDLLVAVEEVKP